MEQTTWKAKLVKTSSISTEHGEGSSLCLQKPLDYVQSTTLYII